MIKYIEKSKPAERATDGKSFMNKQRFRLTLGCIAINLFTFVSAIAQGVRVDLPRGADNAIGDPAALKKSAVIVSIPNGDEYYLGSDLIPLEQLGGKIGDLLKRQNEPERIVYIAGGTTVAYGSIVRVMDVVRKQKVHQLGLIVNRRSEDSVSRWFLIEIPVPVDDMDLRKLKPNPLTLVVSISSDLQLKLNNRDHPEEYEPCFRLVSRYGSANDSSQLTKCMTVVFQYRFEQNAYKAGMETRADLPKDERIERTVYVKASRSIKYGDLISVIDAISGAGASPIGLQVDDLPQ